MPITQIKTVEEFNHAINDDGETSHGKSFILLDFYADWCGPCRRIAPIIEKWSDEEKYNHILFLKVDIEDVAELSQKYEITSLPTFLIFEKGRSEQANVTVMGARQDVLQAQLDTLNSPPNITEDF